MTTSWVLTRPEWIIAGALAALAIFALSWRRRKQRTRAVERTALTLRLIAVGAVTLALAGFAIRTAGVGTTVLVLLDRSDSVPRVRGLGAVSELWEKSDRPGDADRIGMLVFGRDAGLERLPSSELVVPDVVDTVLDASGTDIASALRLAGATFLSAGADGGRRVVVVSDGNANEGDAELEARNLRATGVVVDVCEVEYSHESEVLIEAVGTPARVPTDEPYEISVVVSATRPTRALLRVVEYSDADAEPWQTSDEVDLLPGKNRFSFERSSTNADRRRYRAELTVADPTADGIRENNVGFGFTLVGGARRTLFIGEESEYTPFLDALVSGDIAVEVRSPSELPVTLESYFSFDAIIIANVAAHELGYRGMERIHAVVDGLGVGFVMLGGPSSFGAGGYKDTPIEKLLPVDMDVQKKKELPSGALALILHTCEFAQGNQWAKRIAEKALQALTPRDYFGVAVFDGLGGDRWGVPFGPAADIARITRKLRSLQPADMPAFEPSMRLALTALSGAPTNQKHSIIISDGDPSLPSKQTMAGYVENGISISTICIQPHNGQDTGRLKKIAQDTGGRYYRVDDPNRLPSIFFREALEVRRDMIVEETFLPQVVLDVEATRGLDALPTLDGRISTTPKDLAQVAVIADGEFPDPVLAEWRFGLARTAAFTSDLSGRWSGDWVTWPGFDTFVLQLVRSVALRSQSDLFRVETSVEGRRGRIALDAVDPAGRYVDGLTVEGTLVDPDLEKHGVRFRQTGPGRYEADFDARTAGTALLSLDYDGGAVRGRFQCGVNVPYSPEYRSLESDAGSLRRIAAAGGGRVIRPGDPLFSGDLPAAASDREFPVAWMILAIALFFADIVVRRVRVSLPFLGRSRPTVAASSASAGRPTKGAALVASQRPKAQIDVSAAPAAGEKRRSKGRRSKSDVAPADVPDETTDRLLEAKERLRRRRGER